MLHQSDASALRSEDTDSIMTDEVEVVATASPRVGGRAGQRTLVLDDQEEEAEDEDDIDDDNAAPVASTSAIPIGATPSSPSGLASTLRPATLNEGVEDGSATAISQSANLRPGPVCEYGDRLAYTYFKKPIPTEAQLNTAYAHTPTYWFTIDEDLTYLSFFKDTGPVSAVIEASLDCWLTYCIARSSMSDACIASVCTCTSC